MISRRAYLTTNFLKVWSWKTTLTFCISPEPSTWKIEPVPARPRYLLTEQGVGYRFVESDA